MKLDESDYQLIVIRRAKACRQAQKRYSAEQHYDTLAIMRGAEEDLDYVLDKFNDAGYLITD